MPSEDGWQVVHQEPGQSERASDKKSGYCPQTGIYHSLLRLGDDHQIPTRPDLDTATFVLSHLPHPDHAESRVALIDAATNHGLTYVELKRSIKSLAASLHHGLGVQKGDVVLLLSPNSILYPTICIAALSIGAILTTANPLNTEDEIAKQVKDAGAKLAISANEELHKLAHTKIPKLCTTRTVENSSLSVEELVEGGDPLCAPVVHMAQSDTAVVLYSSGTTGLSKGVVLTHSNLISNITLFKWFAHVTESRDDVFLAFLPMFHIYGLAFFALGLVSVGATTVIMPKFDFDSMLDAVHRHRVTNIPAVPPVILGLIKKSCTSRYDLSSLRRVNSGGAPMSKELAVEFKERFPWVNLGKGYGLTETSGVGTLTISEEQGREHPNSVGMLFPSFCAKVVDVESGVPLPPYNQGELWLRGPTVMKGYLGNEAATIGALDPEGWLRTGDLCYFDDNGLLYVVDRLKELIKHNGYQVAPAELEAILVAHPHILDAAVIPLEDEESGQIPMAYVVRAAHSGLSEDQVIDYVASQVAPYKKIRKVGFISAIPRSTAGKILRKELVVQSQKPISKL